MLHYAQELFEGMKAYRGVDDQIRLFRPMHNMTRMNSSAKRACLPTFDANELLECMRRLINFVIKKRGQTFELYSLKHIIFDVCYLIYTLAIFERLALHLNNF